MGVYEDGEFRYAGRVGTGFTEKTLDDLRRRLGRSSARRARSTSAPKLPREAVFVEPRLVAEVEFREWTTERVMRAPSFKGLRDDKPASEVVLEAAPDGVPAAGRTPTRTLPRRCSTRSSGCPRARCR